MLKVGLFYGYTNYLIYHIKLANIEAIYNPKLNLIFQLSLLSYCSILFPFFPSTQATKKLKESVYQRQTKYKKQSKLDQPYHKNTKWITMNTKKDTTLKIRISTQDKETIRATASKQHKTISTYVRDEALKSRNRWIRNIFKRLMNICYMQNNISKSKKEVIL